MNKQEAISNLKGIKGFYGDDRNDGYVQEFVALDKDEKEAIDMAIETLSTERTGEWTEREDWNGDNYYDCSVCGESFVLIDGTPSMNLYHYCPNCGAKMVGNNDEK